MNKFDTWTNQFALVIQQIIATKFISSVNPAMCLFLKL